MSLILRIITVALLVSCIPLNLLAQETSQESSSEEKNWSLDFSFQEYVLPDEEDLSIPVATLSWNDWIIEARANYEQRRSGSFWLGRPFSFGEEWEFELTPMIGGILGSLRGAAPGFKADISWRSLNIYSEMEYVFDFETRENNFFYSWSEITVGILDWLRIGIVGNRTRAYDSPVDVDRGPIVSVDILGTTISCTVLDLDHSPIWVIGLEAGL